MKKLISMLICLSMVLSMVCLPVYAADETSITPTQQSMLYYADDGSISVGSAYSQMENLWIKFANNGANSLMQIRGFYRDVKNVQVPTTAWYASDSDFVGPVVFEVDSADPATLTFTGGNHTFSDGSASATTESVVVKLDGVDQTKPEEGAAVTKTGSIVEIKVVNKIKAGNNPTGDYALMETVVYTVYDNKIDVEVTLEALEALKIYKYMGLQHCKTNTTYDESIVFTDGTTNYSIAGTSYYPYRSGPKSTAGSVNQIVHTSSAGDKMTMTLDRDYCLGQLTYLDEETDVANVSNQDKSYFHLVDTNDDRTEYFVTMSNGGRAGWKGQYKYEYEQQTATSLPTYLWESDANGDGVFDEAKIADFVENSYQTNSNTRTKRFPDFSIDDSGALKMAKGKQTYVEFLIGEDKIADSDAKKFIIECEVNLDNAGTKTFHMKLNNSTGLGGAYGSAVSGKFYLIYDKTTNKMKMWRLAVAENGGKAYTQMTTTNGVTSSTVKASGNPFDIVLVFQEGLATSYNTMDYLAVYPLADSFYSELTDVTPTSAVLKTNMPVDINNSALKIGDNHVYVTDGDSYNTYVLTYEDELVTGDYTLSGTVNALAYGVDVDVSHEFSVENTQPDDGENTTELYFENFDAAKATEDFSATSKTERFPGFTRENGKLKITRGGHNFSEFNLGEDKIVNSTATKFVVECDLDVDNSGYQPTVNMGLNGSTMLGGAYYVAVSGKYYLIYDKTAKTVEMWRSDAETKTLTQMTTSKGATTSTVTESGDPFTVNFLLVTHAGRYNTMDYLAVYSLEDEFSYTVSNATENSALLTTNMPIDEASEFYVGDIACTIEKLDNTYNKYILIPESPLTVGTHTAEALNVTLIDGTVLTADNVEFEVAAGATSITAIEVAEGANGNKVAKITGTNNIVGVKPVVIIAQYKGDALSAISYEYISLPFGGAFDEAPAELSLSAEEAEGETYSYKAFIWENMNNMRPLK